MKRLIVALALTGCCLLPSTALAEGVPDPATVAVVPVPVAPTSPDSGGSPMSGVPSTTNPGAASDGTPSVVVVNSGPSMDEIKQQTPGLFLSALGGLLTALAQELDDVLKVATGFNFLTQTPPGLSYNHPDIQRLWGSLRAAADAALALVAMAGGYNVVLRRHLGARSDGALELLPRLVVGALLVNTSIWWTSLAIDANNALCSAIGGAGFPGWGRIAGDALLAGAAGLAAIAWTPAQLVLVVAVLLYLALCLVFVLQMLMRLVLVDVLLIVAPLGLLCWILPQTQRWARLWSGTFVSTVFTQFIQVAALVLASDLLSAIGSGAGPAGAVLGPFLGLATLILVLKLPGFVGREVSNGWSAVRGLAIGTAARTVSPVAATAITAARAPRNGVKP